jgi:hypothetical protein
MTSASYEPDDKERTALGQVLAMPGFEVIEKIAESECAKFDVRLKNLDAATTPGGPDKYEALVIEYHREAKVASMVWEGVRQRLEREQEILARPKPRGATPADAIEDVTEGL